MFAKIIIFILGVALGIVVIIYHRWFVRTVGASGWAERYLGAGGTYLMWQLIGLLIIVITVLYSTGMSERVLNALFGWL